jgi:hypothetical protein
MNSKDNLSPPLEENTQRVLDTLCYLAAVLEIENGQVQT